MAIGSTRNIYRLKVVGPVLLVYYLVPYIFDCLGRLVNIDLIPYKRNDLLFWGLILIYILFIFWPIRYRYKLPRLLFLFSKIWSKNVLIIFILFYIPLCVTWVINFGLNFRQNSSVTFSNSGLLPMAIFIGNLYVRVLVLHEIISSSTKGRITGRLTLFVLLICQISTITASFDIIYIAFLLVLFISPSVIDVSGKRLTLGIILFAPIVLLGVMFIGFANKIGADRTLILFRENGDTILNHLVFRLSNWYFSIHIFSYERAVMLLDGDNVLINVIKEFSMRVRSLFESNYSINHADVWSYSRFNYLMINSNNSNPITGSSPGPLGTILYASLKFSSIIAWVFLIYLFKLVLNSIYALGVGKKPLAILYVTMLCLGLMDSLLDQIIIVSPVTIVLILIMSIYVKFIRGIHSI